MPTPLTSLQNIGKKTKKHLNEIGVFSKEDLEKIGAVDAWIMMKTLRPHKDICICALYALVGAIEGLCWYELPEDLKKIYKKRADKYVQELSSQDINKSHTLFP